MPYLLLIFTTLFWSGNFVLSRAVHASIPPVGLSFWRWVGAFAILCLFGLRHLIRERDIAWQNIRFLAVQGLLGVTGFNTFIYLATQTTTAINAVLVNSCIPILIVVVSWILYRETLQMRQIIGVGLSMGGVVLIIARGHLETLLQLTFTRGDLYVLIAASLWATYSANLKRCPKELHPFAYLTAIVIIGILGLFPFYLMEIASGRTTPLTMSTFITVLYLALFASVLAFIFWNRAVRTVGANKAGPFIHLMPVFSTLLAIIFLDERLMVFHLQGIALIALGIIMTTFRIQHKS